jgi:hypothetical protein
MKSKFKSFKVKNIFSISIMIGWPKVLLLTLSKDKIMHCLVAGVGSFLCPLLISCVLYVAMICIKKKKFANKIVPATQIVDANIAEGAVPVCSNQNSINPETEGPNRERTKKPKVKNKNINCPTAASDSSESSLSDFLQDQTNSVDAQEVIQIFSNILFQIFPDKYQIKKIQTAHFFVIMSHSS